MVEIKKCPNCGTENTGLNLIETQGVYICCKCKKLIDTNKNVAFDSDRGEADETKK